MIGRILEIGYQERSVFYSSPIKHKFCLNVYFLLEPCNEKQEKNLIDFSRNTDSVFYDSGNVIDGKKIKFSTNIVSYKTAREYVSDLINIISNDTELIINMHNEEDLFIKEFCRLFTDIFETVDKKSILYNVDL